MSKPDAYYENERADVVAKLPRPLGAVLDVGCGAGAVGRALRAAGAERLVGIEYVPEQAERARTVFDEVHAGDAVSLLQWGEVRGPFDTVVLYDVLEHLPDPVKLLSALHGVMAPGGRVHVSVPNARHFSLVRDLVFRGTFGYTEWGHRDATHLRWFTRRDIVATLERCGFGVRGVDAAVLGRGQALDRALRRRATEFLALQWHVLAIRP